MGNTMASPDLMVVMQNHKTKSRATVSAAAAVLAPMGGLSIQRRRYWERPSWPFWQTVLTATPTLMLLQDPGSDGCGCGLK